MLNPTFDESIKFALLASFYYSSTNHYPGACISSYGNVIISAIKRHNWLCPAENPLCILRGCIYTTVRHRFTKIIVPVSGVNGDSIAMKKCSPSYPRQIPTLGISPT